MDYEKRKSIGPHTLVSLGTATLIIGVSISTTWRASTLVSKTTLESREIWSKHEQSQALQFQALNNQMADLKRTLDTMRDNAWTRQEQEIFTLRLKIDNPAIKIPDAFGPATKRLDTGAVPK